MKIENKLIESVQKGVKELYGQDVPEKMVQLQKTKKEFEVDIVEICIIMKM